MTKESVSRRTCVTIGCVLATLLTSSSQGQCEIEKLTASDAGPNKSFGRSVALSGHRAIVTGGGAYIFERDGNGNWNELGKLPRTGSIAISGDLAIVGSPLDDDVDLNAGASYILERKGGAIWNEVVKMFASDAAVQDYFGTSVGISDDRAVVGAYGNRDAGSSTGSAYIFARNQGGTDNWGEVKKLIASDAAIADQFGWSVGISGDRAIVGAHGNNDSGSDSGSAYIFALGDTGSDNVDCNENGIRDGCDIHNGDSIDGNFNGVPDECEIDCNSNKTPDAADIVSGASADCNSNLVPDECDIDVGRSLDCNANLIPDECEPDCNLNDIADACDLASGLSCDRNGNDVLDECESYCLADLNCNGVVNVDDLLLLISAWGAAENIADLNGSGIVNVDDLLILIGAWGPCP